MVHIGMMIELELRAQERTVSWLARKLCCNRQNVYDIFRRESIDTSLLSPAQRRAPVSASSTR